jgi:hypothetical protein
LESEDAQQTEMRAPSRIAQSNVPDSIAGWMAAAERCAREEPLKCAGVVAAVGVVGSILPLGRLIGSLVRPVLMIAGVVKVLEEVERRRNS